MEGADAKDLMAKLGGLSEVFGEPCCGVCGGKNILPNVRDIKGNKYYELVCKEPGCGAYLSFGQKKVGGSLFPKRKLEPNDKPGRSDSETARVGKTNGWTRYRGPLEDNDEEPQRQQQEDSPAPQTRQQPAPVKYRK